MADSDLIQLPVRWEPAEHDRLRRAAFAKLGGHESMADIVRAATRVYLDLLEAGFSAATTAAGGADPFAASPHDGPERSHEETSRAAAPSPDPEREPFVEAP